MPIDPHVFHLYWSEYFIEPSYYEEILERQTFNNGEIRNVCLLNEAVNVWNCKHCKRHVCFVLVTRTVVDFVYTFADRYHYDLLFMSYTTTMVKQNTALNQALTNFYVFNVSNVGVRFAKRLPVKNLLAVSNPRVIPLFYSLVYA